LKSARLKALNEILEAEYKSNNIRPTSLDGEYSSLLGKALSDYSESKGLVYDPDKDALIDDKGIIYDNEFDFIEATEPKNVDAIATYLEGIATEKDPRQMEFLDNQNKAFAKELFAPKQRPVEQEEAPELFSRVSSKIRSRMRALE